MIEEELLPEGRPFLIPGDQTGFLLLHGFTSMPEEMRPLADHLAGRGHTVLAIRLPGHGSHPVDLAQVYWTDWLLAVEDGLAILRSITTQVIVAGLSMGGMLALVAAARFPLHAVIAMSTPYYRTKARERQFVRLMTLLRQNRSKGVDWHPQWEERREADYPAYPTYPAAVLQEIIGLREALHEALPMITVPVLLMQSTDDDYVAPETIDLLASRIPAERKVARTFAGMDHAIIRDGQRTLVFAVIDEFLLSLPIRSEEESG